MTIEIQSTTDSQEAVTAAMGDLAQTKKVEEAKPAADEAEAKPKETEVVPEGDESDESQAEVTEEKESEDLEAKENEADGGDGEKPKKKGGFQKRIDKLSRQKAQAESEREYWRTEALRAQSSKGPAKETETAQTKSDPSEPKPEQFETHEQYLKATARWEVKQELAAEKKLATESQAKTEVQTKLQKHLERVESFKASHDDFDDALENVSHIPMTVAVKESIVESEHSADLMYELSNNPKELERICKLGPYAAAKEIGKIEAKFSKESNSSSEKKTSKAPTPITPVRTRGASNQKSIYDENISQREYEKLRAQQLKSARE